MAVQQIKMLPEADVHSLIDRILRDRFSEFGYAGSEIEEVEDFDGERLFRLTAEVSEKVPARAVMEATDAVHSALRREGEFRFIIISPERPPDENLLPDEDVD
tara:strand:+ start:846 stop:1154 length:309 start_codon:yes stop_codon:yes gene_type:complete